MHEGNKIQKVNGHNYVKETIDNFDKIPNNTVAQLNLYGPLV